MCSLLWNQLHIIALIDFNSQSLELHLLIFNSKPPVISCCFQAVTSGSLCIHLLLIYWPYITSDFLLIHSSEAFVPDYIETYWKSLARASSPGTQLHISSLLWGLVSLLLPGVSSRDPLKEGTCPQRNWSDHLGRGWVGGELSEGPIMPSNDILEGKCH